MLKIANKYGKWQSVLGTYVLGAGGGSCTLDTVKKGNKCLRKIRDVLVDLEEAIKTQATAVKKMDDEAGDDEKKLEKAKAARTKLNEEVEASNKELMDVEAMEENWKAFVDVLNTIDWTHKDNKGKYGALDMLSVDDVCEQITEAIEKSKGKKE